MFTTTPGRALLDRLAGAISGSAVALVLVRLGAARHDAVRRETRQDG
ncbi:hypothetical protein SAMN05443575_1076 [Jatrophihabitans endophyticus]|uniref:Uncharacterized protein n=1 Tax=Jatrophihabitans endophyticus TaxID=1206085 RepID=A0A1M5G714_9ACTN|nr:hypothetical protein SAMN05443575_1076 [Jatrophihabitans endophyticus]